MKTANQPRHPATILLISALLACQVLTGCVLGDDSESGSETDSSRLRIQDLQLTSADLSPGGIFPVQGKVLSSAPLDSIAVDLWDPSLTHPWSSQSFLAQQTAIPAGTTSWDLKAQGKLSLSFTNVACDGDYQLKLTAFSGGESEARTLPFRFQGGMSCDDFTFGASLAVGAPASANPGILDLGQGTALSSQAAFNRPDKVDLVLGCYGDSAVIASAQAAQADPSLLAANSLPQAKLSDLVFAKLAAMPKDLAEAASRLAKAEKTHRAAVKAGDVLVVEMSGGYPVIVRVESLAGSGMEARCSVRVEGNALRQSMHRPRI